MKIACNSAYVQTETLTQAVIVYFYICSNSQEFAMPNAKCKCTSHYFLPLISDSTLITSKQSNGRLGLHTVTKRTGMNAQNAPAFASRLDKDSSNRAKYR